MGRNTSTRGPITDRVCFTVGYRLPTTEETLPPPSLLYGEKRKDIGIAYIHTTVYPEKI
jgi:hypothetical protein